MRASATMALFVALLAAPGMAGTARDIVASQAAPAGGKVQVWRGTPGPQSVRFDGEGDFTPHDTYFEAVLPAATGPELRDIAIGFAGYEVPLRLIAARDGGRTIRFTVAAPRYTQCERPDVQAVMHTAPSGTIDERVGLLIRIRRLIDLCRAQAYVVPKLELKYYEVSCSLAGDRNSFFAIHQDAKERFVRLERTSFTQQTDRDCRGRGTGGALHDQWSGAVAALGQGEHAAAVSAAEDMLAKVGDPKWQDGFVTQGLNSDRVRELKVMALAAEQNAVARRDPDRAIAVNDELRALHKDDDFKGTMEKLGVSEQRLVTDRSYLEGLQASRPQ